MKRSALVQGSVSVLFSVDEKTAGHFWECVRLTFRDAIAQGKCKKVWLHNILWLSWIIDLSITHYDQVSISIMTSLLYCKTNNHEISINGSKEDLFLNHDICPFLVIKRALFNCDHSGIQTNNEVIISNSASFYSRGNVNTRGYHT